MNTQEIIENNKLIGLYNKDIDASFKYDGYKFTNGVSWIILNYQNSYSELMPILQKIQNSGCIIEINYALVFTCRICYLGKNKYDKAINFYGDNNGGKEPIMAIYECVVEFLKYLEENK